MSLFGSFLNEFDEDPIFGHHMQSMRQMNSMMNTMFADPFGMFGPAMQGPSALTGAAGHHQHQHHHQHHHQQQQQLAYNQHHRNAAALMPFGFAGVPNINRLLNAQMPGGGVGGTSFSSSQVISMTHGPDGRPQIYKATSSMKQGPGGVCETQKTVQDSRSGLKKMAIGHHIGERAHVIEREKNLRTGEEAERQDFVNLEEEEAEDFDREFTNRSRSMMAIQNGGGGAAAGGGGHRRQNDVPAIMPSASSPNSSSSPTPSISNRRSNPINPRHSPLVTARRPLRTPSLSPLALPSTSITYTPPTTSIHPHPYNASSRRANRPLKGSAHHTAAAASAAGVGTVAVDQLQQQQQQQQNYHQNRRHHSPSDPK